MANLKPATYVFSDALANLMRELGYTTKDYTQKELRTTIALCTVEFDAIWTEFLEWVEHGDDQRAKTLDVIRASLEVGGWFA